MRLVKKRFGKSYPCCFQRMCCMFLLGTGACLVLSLVAVLDGLDSEMRSWEPYKLPGDSPKHLPNRYRLNPRPIPGGTQQMLVHLKADTRNQCFLPGQVEELYDFYQWKIKEDIALERSLAGLLDHVPSLAALSDCCYGRSRS